MTTLVRGLVGGLRERRRLSRFIGDKNGAALPSPIKTTTAVPSPMKGKTTTTVTSQGAFALTFTLTRGIGTANG
ncbi:MAG: hypothetical protein MPL62_05260 [Alphaproteobacteria bacterium]|nr:hypothetical protein [Alphaproteobacteria bacterium]